MEWYKSLDIHTRINCKDCFELLCGVEFSQIGRLLDFRERITIMYDKLQMEGFI